jgi:hypothetical protein
MRSLSIAIPLLVLVAAPSFAEDRTLQECTALGYFSGAQDKFMIGLALHILTKKGVLNTAPCNAAREEAYDVGVSFSRSGKIANSAEAAVVKSVAAFSAAVYSAVAKNMEP